jgi:1-acyl-sn-glycerol-3-phosphate acyltransferase
MTRSGRAGASPDEDRRPDRSNHLAERHERLVESVADAQRAAYRRRLKVNERIRDELAIATESRVEDAFEAGAAENYGLDLGFRERTEPIFRFLFENYWRVDVSGLDAVPETGGCILVGNHSGGLPFDATMVAYALSQCAGGPKRIARPLYDGFVEGMATVRDLYRKLGGVPARYAVADELLSRGELPTIFPEGVAGVAKLYDERYQLTKFSTSAARLSCRHRVPIVPFAVIGAEETYPMIGRSSTLGRLLGAPYVPITPFFPLLGAAGMIPLPTKWRIVFGPRIYLYRESRFRGPAGLDFEAMSERLRRTVQILLRRQLGRRSSIFLG